MKRFFHILMLTLVPLFVAAQDEVSMSVSEANAEMGFDDNIDRLADDFVSVALVICDPSDVLYSTLGHAALHLKCPTFDLDYIFSYESENVEEKIWTFLKGDLKMGLFAIPTEEFLAGYWAEGRGVREYELALSPQQKMDLWRVMDQHVMEGTNIPYDYFHRGCAKSVVMVMHEALGRTPIEYAPWSDKFTRQTQRELVRNYITDASWCEAEMYFLIGIDGDRDYVCEKKLIVPDHLVEVWQTATLNGLPMLSSEATTLVPSELQLHDTWCTPTLVTAVLLLLALLSVLSLWSARRSLRIAGRVVDYTVLAVQTILGAVMTYLICFSGLPCTDWNWLIIPFNILPIVFWHGRRYWAIPYAVLLLIWIIAMVAYPHVLVDWSHWMMALAWLCTLMKEIIIYKPSKIQTKH